MALLKGTKQVTDNLNKWMEDRLRGVEGLNKVIASKAQTEARTNAPWYPVTTPKKPPHNTGNARQGLTAITYRKGTSFFIALYHKVVYGKWLELKDDGRLAIIEKTLNSLRLEWFQGVRRLLNKSTRI